MVDSDMEVMVDSDMEVMVDSDMEAMVDSGMEAMVDTDVAAMVDTAMDTVVMGIVTVHLLIKIMRIHSQEITNHNLTINLKHMAKLRRILKLMPSLNHILKRTLNLKRMIILKHTVSRKPIHTLIHKQLTLKLV